MKEYKNLQLEYNSSPWATHQPLLIWVSENTSGDILELGCGEHSTQLLRSFLPNTNRLLVSVESQRDWFEKYKSMEQNNHKFMFVENWEQTIDHLAQKEWSVVFIDQDPHEARKYALDKFLDKAEYIVMHDSDYFPEFRRSDYNWLDFIPTEQPDPSRNGPSSFLISRKHSLNNIYIRQ